MNKSKNKNSKIKNKSKVITVLEKSVSLRENMVVGGKNDINDPLVGRGTIILPPLHIKLSLMKQFLKALDKNGLCFVYIGGNMHKLSTEKIIAEILDNSLRTLSL